MQESDGGNQNSPMAQDRHAKSSAWRYIPALHRGRLTLTSFTGLFETPVPVNTKGHTDR